MPDFLDRVQERELEALEALNARAKLAPLTPPPDGRDCVGCGDPIPELRLRACPAAIRCMDCEELEEVRCGRPRWRSRPHA